MNAHQRRIAHRAQKRKFPEGCQVTSCRHLDPWIGRVRWGSFRPRALARAALQKEIVAELRRVLDCTDAGIDPYPSLQDGKYGKPVK